MGYYSIDELYHTKTHKGTKTEVFDIHGLQDYTIPKLIRELKPQVFASSKHKNYTIPKLIRELKPRNTI